MVNDQVCVRFGELMGSPATESSLQIPQSIQDELGACSNIDEL